MNKYIEGTINKAETAKKWCKKHAGVIKTGAIFAGGIFLGAVFGTKIGSMKHEKGIDKSMDMMFNLGCVQGSYKFYHWMEETVPEAKELCDKFADQYPEKAKVVLGDVTMNIAKKFVEAKGDGHYISQSL